MSSLALEPSSRRRSVSHFVAAIPPKENKPN
jgi:hypothetical protein